MGKPLLEEDAQSIEHRPTRRELAWGIVRLVLGIAQMIGAVLSASLLIHSGVNEASLTCAVATCVLTSISVLIFGRRK